MGGSCAGGLRLGRLLHAVRRADSTADRFSYVPVHRERRPERGRESAIAFGWILHTTAVLYLAVFATISPAPLMVDTTFALFSAFFLMVAALAGTGVTAQVAGKRQ
ncbi:hypothetical protein GCM10010915_06200 [Microbacterium faecale]|uniref:Uncharacterized protein n=1 Tax=Microbacterium faecale TaxID=1804630 RepID=A0A917DDS9_9MICO|nr:hypothetical protein GCM10010915_06200 [Microbacterium faecale]